VARRRWRSISTALAAVVPLTLVSAYLMNMPARVTGPLPRKSYPGAAAPAGTARRPTHQPIRPSPLYQQLPGYWQRGCLDQQESASLDRCVFGETTRPRLTVALVGDSIAGNWWVPLTTIARRQHWELVTELHGSCEWTAAMLTDPFHRSGPYRACHTWGVKVLHDLLSVVRPDLVITSGLATHRAVAEHGTRSRADVGAGMAQYWRTLVAHGIRVLAIRSTPLFPFNVRNCITRFSASAATEAKVSACSTPRARAVVKLQPFDYAVRQLRGKAEEIGLDSLMCGQQLCRPVVGNILVYNDDHHITPAFSATLTPFLEKRLLETSPLLGRVVKRSK
jgi:SGNH domain (fused to AT3 domains)